MASVQAAANISMREDIEFGTLTEWFLFQWQNIGFL
jgi:hypothetical protein